VADNKMEEEIPVPQVTGNPGGQSVMGRQFLRVSCAVIY